MNTRPDGSAIESPVIIPPGRRMYWSVRRELWESRSIYLAPFGVAALILIGFLLGTIHLSASMRAALAIDSAEHDAIKQPYTLAALLLMGTTFLVAVFYCLDALHGERRDRSILFWKSLPVSDVTTVLSKASIPLIVLPLLTFGITVITQSIMLLIGSMALLARGLNPGPLWAHVSLLPASMMLLYHLVAIHGLGYAPIYGWLLLVSAWARRAVFLWAALPLLAIGAVERIVFNTSHFVGALGYVMGGGLPPVPLFGGDMPMERVTLVTIGGTLTSPSLWIGLLITAAFLTGAVRLRRSRGPI